MSPRSKCSSNNALDLPTGLALSSTIKIITRGPLKSLKGVTLAGILLLWPATPFIPLVIHC